jgi:hypothetical protein
MQSHALPHPGYRPDIDGLRAVAVLSVLLFHAFPDALKGGFVGVDVFFVISGYLIGTIILGGLRDGTFTFREFYVRRIRRIFPALELVLLATLAAGAFLLPNARFAELGKYTLAGAGFIANLALWQDSGYFDSDAEGKPLLHLWSLGIEEQFYIIWPVILFSFWRLRRNVPLLSRSRQLAALMLVLFLVSLTLNLAWVRNAPSTAFYLPWSRAWELFAGSLLAYLHLVRPITGENHRHWLSWTGGFLLLAGLLTTHKGHLFPGWRALLPVLGTVLLIAAGPQAPLNRRLLGHPLALWFGLISYPLYLWHWPLLSIARVVEFDNPNANLRLALLLASIALAYATYRWLELPIRQRRSPLGRSPALLGGMTFIAALGLVIWQAQGLPERHVRNEAQLALLDHYERLHKHGLRDAYRAECDFYDWKTGKARSAIATSCTQAGLRGTVFLWGDSHAQAISLGLGEVLPQGYALAQVASSGCPPDFPDSSLRNPGCKLSNETALAEIGRLKPDLVVLAQRDKHEEKDWAALARGLRLAGAGRVLVLGPLPQWHPSLPMVVVRSGRPEPGLMLSEGLDPAPGRTSEEMARRDWTADRLTYLSPVDVLCKPDHGCLARLDQAGPYNLSAVDYSHLSPEGSRLLAQRLLRPRIGELLRGSTTPE